MANDESENDDIEMADLETRAKAVAEEVDEVIND